MEIGYWKGEEEKKREIWKKRENWGKGGKKGCGIVRRKKISEKNIKWGGVFTWRYNRRRRCMDPHSAAGCRPCCWDTLRSGRTRADSWAGRPRSQPGRCRPRARSPRGTAHWGRMATARRECAAAQTAQQPNYIMSISTFNILTTYHIYRNQWERIQIISWSQRNILLNRIIQ